MCHYFIQGQCGRRPGELTGKLNRADLIRKSLFVVDPQVMVLLDRPSGILHKPQTPNPQKNPNPTP